MLDSSTVILNDSEVVQPDVVGARRRLDREIKARRYAANGVARFRLVDPMADAMAPLPDDGP